MAWALRRAAASVISGVTNGLPSRSPAPQLLAEHFTEGIAGGLAHFGRSVEQAIFEVPDHLAHLVEHARAVATHLVGQPEQLNLGLDVLFEPAQLARGRALAADQRVSQARLQLE